MNENTDYERLQREINTAASNASTISNMESERKNRAKSLIITDYINKFSIDEWLINLNCFIYVEYGIKADYDFFQYKHPTRNIERILSEAELSQELEHMRKEATMNNIYYKFIEIITQTNGPINLYNLLYDYINNFYKNNAPLDGERRILQELEPNTNLIDRCMELIEFIINKLIGDIVTTPTTSVNSTEFINNMQKFIETRFPNKLPQDYKLGLPASAIDNIFNYKIINSSGETPQIDSTNSLNKFKELFVAKFKSIPCWLILSGLGNGPEVDPSLPINQTVVITANNTPLNSLEQIGSVETNQTINTNKPVIEFTFTNNNEYVNQKQYIQQLLETYNEPKLYITSFISEPYYRELFAIASFLFNSYDFYKAINICRYIGTKHKFDEQRETKDERESRIQQLQKQQKSVDLSTVHNKNYHILDPEVKERPPAKIKPLVESELDKEFYRVQKADKSKYIIAIMFITLLLVLITLIIYWACLKRKQNNKAVAYTQAEAYNVLNRSSLNREHFRKLQEIRERFNLKRNRH